MNLLLEQFENEALDRIVRFSKIADKMHFEICLGFSGGKDSQFAIICAKELGLNLKHTT